MKMIPKSDMRKNKLPSALIKQLTKVKKATMECAKLDGHVTKIVQMVEDDNNLYVIYDIKSIDDDGSKNMRMPMT
jgi:hypothetical protein